MLLGYNTNGMAHHDLCDAIALLADLGYRSVAITLDHGALNPFAPLEMLESQIAQVSELLSDRGMRCVIETGARFLLDPRQKHEPTLMTADEEGRRRRVEFYLQAIRIAQSLRADCASLWSGVLHESIAQEQAMDRLIAGLEPVVSAAEQAGVVLGFEPEPGMFIDTMDRYEMVDQRLDSPAFQLTLDIGHLHCQGETPLADQVRRWSRRIVNVHIEDMRAGVHEHLMFGEGEIDFPPVIAALRDAGYRGPLHVELSRHSHMAAAAARQARDFLSPLLMAGDWV